MPTTNDLSAIIPELWVKEALLQLRSNVVMPNLVYRQFEANFQQPGDVVNVPIPPTYTYSRKQRNTDIVVQSTTIGTLPIKLNQHLYWAADIEDVDVTKSLVDMTTMYLTPGAKALAEGLNAMIFGQYADFGLNQSGKIGTDVSDAGLVGLGEQMTRNKAPRENRRLVVGPGQEADILQIDKYVSLNTVGSANGLLNGQIGRIRGFDIFVTQDAAEIDAAGMATRTGAINLVAGYAAGSTSLVVDGLTGSVVTGSFIKIAGDNQLHTIASSSLTSTDTTGIVITPALSSAVVNDAVITIYTPGAVNYGSGYAAGYSDTLVVDGFTGATALKVGQGVMIGNYSYSIIGVNVSTNVVGITLNRPLDEAVANDTVVAPFPPANYGFAFNPQAVSFVCRPLKPVPSGTGVLSISQNSVQDGISMRLQYGYNIITQKMTITLDMLCGVTTLNDSLGGILLS